MSDLALKLNRPKEKFSYVCLVLKVFFPSRQFSLKMNSSSEERKLTRAFSLLDKPAQCATPPSKSPIIYPRTMSSSSGTNPVFQDLVGPASLSSSSSFCLPSAFTFENTTFRFCVTQTKYFKH